MPLCLKLLRAYVPSFFTCLRAYEPIFFVVIYIFCLYALIFHVLTCLKPLISTLCNKVSNQLNAIGRIKKYLGFKEKEVLFNSFIYSNFNCCPLVWHFYSSKSLYKIERTQERALRLLHNDFTGDYVELLKKQVKPQWK